MLRTRDVYLFVVILLFLAIGTGVTYVYEQFGLDLFHHDALLGSTIQSQGEYEGLITKNTKNREETIQRLREAILSDNSLTLMEPSVETTLDSTQSEETRREEFSVQNCNFDTHNETHTLQQWPLQNVTVQVKNATRFVLHTELVPLTIQNATTSSTTKPQTEMRVTELLQMPVFPQLLNSAACVSQDAIGITTTGSLLFNQDAKVYLQSTEKELIGFARDGFPIHGVFEGETDECGGYLHQEGYRYVLKTDRSVILGCFRGISQPLMAE